MKSGIIKFPDYINEISRIIGKLRDLSNAEMNEFNERFKRGDRSEYVNILGVKGELIVRHYLFTKDIQHESCPLFSNKPVTGADIVINKIHRIDVKTIRTDASDLLVNVEAHNKEQKNIDYYWFVQVLDNNTARYWIFSYKEVSKWSIKNVTYTDAYYKPLKEFDV